MRNFASYSTSLKFELPAFKSAARYTGVQLLNKLATQRWSPYGEVGSTHPEPFSKYSPHATIARPIRAKSSTTQPLIIHFAQILYGVYTARHLKCSKSSRSRGQRSRSQRDITCAKIRKNINNSAGDCLISLKVRTDFHHVTLDVSRSTGHSVT